MNLSLHWGSHTLQGSVSVLVYTLSSPVPHIVSRAKDKAQSNYCNLWSKQEQCPRQIQPWHRVAAHLKICRNLRLLEWVVPRRCWNRIIIFVCEEKRLEVNHRYSLCLQVVVDLMSTKQTVCFTQCVRTQHYISSAGQSCSCILADDFK